MKRMALSIFFSGVVSLLCGTGSVFGIEVSQSHPFFVFPAPESAVGTSEAQADLLGSVWADLPEFYRNHSAMMVQHVDSDMETREEWTRTILKSTKSSTIPLTLGIANGIRNHYYLPPAIEKFLAGYPNIQALYVEDFQFGSTGQDGDLAALRIEPQIEWLKIVISLATKFDKKLIIRLDELNPLILMSNPTYRSLYETILVNKNNVILIYPQGGVHTILGNTALMGLWLEGAIGNWGVSMQSSASSKAGFVAPGAFGKSSSDNTTPAQSTFVYRGWLLSAAMAGATTYVFDDPSELWAGTHTRFWGQSIAPTLLELVQKGYVARQDLVKRNAPVAYRVKTAVTWTEFEQNLVDLDPVFHEGHLMRGAYGVELPGQIPEWIPNTGKYYFIPILSPYALDDVLFSFKEVMMPGAVVNAAAWPERLSSYYTSDGEGTAFTKKVGRAFFVFHTHENGDETQSYSLSGIPAPLYDISATRQGDKVTVDWPFREGDVSYSVYRAVNPNLDAMHNVEFLEVAHRIDSRSFVDEGISPGETVIYSVTALTNERTTLSGTVNSGDYKVFSAVESRRDAFALIEPYTMRSRSVNGIPDPYTEVIELHPWWSIPVSVQEHVQRASESISNTFQEFATHYQQENIEELMELFSDDYMDSSGVSKKVMRELFSVLFAQNMAGPLHRQFRDWNLNDFEFSGEIIVNAFVQMTALAESEVLISPSSRSFSESGNAEFEITFFEHHDGSWKIKKTEPPILQVSDIVAR
jgi:hypothetical protein